MTHTNYGFTKIVPYSFDEAVVKATEALKEKGFGVLTEIDVKETMKKKLDEDIKPYRILGACNPGFAFKALQSEEQAGLMLPCNVIVYVNKNDDGTGDFSRIRKDSFYWNKKVIESCGEEL